MKFNGNGRLRFDDLDGDALRADVYQRSDQFLILSVNGRAVAMTREEARKFVKAIRKEVRKVQV